MKKRKLVSIFICALTALCSSCNFFGKKDKDNKITEISFKLSKETIQIGESCIINEVKITPTSASASDIEFTVENPSIVSLSGYIVTGESAGMTYIIATAKDGSGINKRVPIHVKSDEKVLVDSLTLELSSTSIFVDEKVQASVLVHPGNATNQSVSLVASPEGKVSIKEREITALQAGTVSIKAVSKDGSKVESNSVSLTIKNVEATGIILNPSNVGLHVGEEVNLNATVTPSNAYDKNISYKTESGNQNIVSVSSNGTVKGISSGEEYVVAYMTNNPSISSKIKFTVEPVEPTSVSASVSKTTLYLDEEIQISSQVYPSNAFSLEVSYRVESGNDTVLTVTSSGKVLGVGPGTDSVIVYCTYRPDIKKKITFNVLDYTNPLDPSGDDIFEGV